MGKGRMSALWGTDVVTPALYQNTFVAVGQTPSPPPPHVTVQRPALLAHQQAVSHPAVEHADTLCRASPGRGTPETQGFMMGQGAGMTLLDL